MADSDPAKGLAELLRSLKAEGAPPAAAAPLSGESARPGAAEGPARASAELAEFLKGRVAELEAALAAERERARAAESGAARREENRGAVEEQLRAISELLKRERDASHSRGRIEALEARLDKMHEAWAAALEKPARREAPADAGPEPAALRELLSGALESHGGRLTGLEARLDKMHEAWAAALAELAALRGLLSGVLEGQGARLTGLEVRLDAERAALHRRLETSEQEARELRALLAAGLEEAARRGACAEAAAMDLFAGVERSRAEMETVGKRLFVLSQAVERARLGMAENAHGLRAELGGLSARLEARVAALTALAGRLRGGP